MAHNDFILVGAGGHALSLAEFNHNNIKGYIALEKTPDMPGEWLGDDDSASKFVEEGYLFHVAFVYAGFPLMRKRAQIIREYEKIGANFKTLIAPSAIVTPNSLIGEGSAIMQGAIVNRAKIGRHVIVNSGAIVEHDCLIDDNSFIGPGTVIGGFTSIGKNCFIGLGARIMNGIKIADNISVAMGAIVNRDLTEPGIYHGQSLRRHKL